MTRKIDETNKTIIRSLKDGRKAYSAIADELGITENTVRTRVNKMIEDGVLQITGLVNPEYIPSFQVAMMGIKVKTLDLETKARELTKLRGVINCAVVTGRYDLILQIELCDSEGLSLLEFFKNELNRVKDITEVETFIVYQSHNLVVPYLL
ncbi:MAG: Lrp/AsnC family transcriptional regulator [Bullifex sp.]|nr:Lrp/AsnC family transcriptional regulator [Spirochaetales bacterium]MDY2815090.1 Lrp/AsnC family transcriptional regulator [Bullifex sp.]MDD7009355.1 Lrp/AsnC family transcriptional regulator [Spirochaetales bacterium]MDD7536254.1 Lrp/AsnC family transcriptional regulator [Spirochaetales bacterium]MDY3850058.1 Lrp/AsnC family transcriptional regulator [Bullifex sp.]